MSFCDLHRLISSTWYRPRTLVGHCRWWGQSDRDLSIPNSVPSYSDRYAIYRSSSRKNSPTVKRLNESFFFVFFQFVLMESATKRPRTKCIASGIISDFMGNCRSLLIRIFLRPESFFSKNIFILAIGNNYSWYFPLFSAYPFPPFLSAVEPQHW